MAIRVKRLKLLVAGLLSGCHLYSQGNDLLAQQIQKGYQDLKISSALDDEKKLSDETLQAELDSARKFSEAVRDQRTVLLFEMPVAVADGRPCAAKSLGQAGSLLCEIDTRLYDVTGLDGADAEAFAQAAAQTELDADVEKASTQIRTIAAAHNLKALAAAATCSEANAASLRSTQPLTHPSFASWPSEDRTAFKALLDAYAGPNGACTQLLKAHTVRGDLGAARQETQARQREFAAATEAAGEIKAEYDKTKSAYDQAVKAGGAISEAELQLKRVLAGIDDKVAASAARLSAGHLTGNPTEVEALQARAKVLSDAIGRILSGGKDADAGRVSVMDGIITLQQIDRERSLPSLLIQAEIVHGRLLRAQALVALASSQIAALDDREKALMRAFTELWKARLALVAGHVPTLTCPAAAAKTRVGNVLAPNDCGRAVAEAMLRYANAWTIGFGPAREAYLRFVGAIDRGGLDRSAASLEMWERLLAVPINQLVLYHSGGVKPEAIAKLVVDAIGLGGLIATTAVQAAK